MQVKLVNLAECDSLKDKQNEINEALNELSDKWINHVYIQETQVTNMAVIVYSERTQKQHEG
jgi:tRNA/tmRNA/rRNA uracil-C5-methylase (TrmA/RlmC/RlmD family)